jgi:hypothetical protein
LSCVSSSFFALSVLLCLRKLFLSRQPNPEIGKLVFGLVALTFYSETATMPPRKKQVESDPEEDFDDVDEEDEEDYRPAKVKNESESIVDRCDVSRARACNVVGSLSSHCLVACLMHTSNA